jgi:hypothetical protein
MCKRENDLLKIDGTTKMKYNKNVLNQDLQAQGKKAPNQY